MRQTLTVRETCNIFRHPSFLPSYPRIAKAHLTMAQNDRVANGEDGLEYPHCLPTFIEGIDDGPMAVRELQAQSLSWRAEKYAADSNLLVLEHIDGASRSGCYNDEQIDELLEVRFPLNPPIRTRGTPLTNRAQKPQKSQVRFMVLLPTPCETITVDDEQTAKTIEKDELGRDSGASTDEDAPRISQFAKPTPAELNISRKSLVKILTKYNVAPAACSHIRGQEQVYGSRVLRDLGETKSFGTCNAWRTQLRRKFLANDMNKSFGMPFAREHSLTTWRRMAT